MTDLNGMIKIFLMFSYDFILWFFLGFYVLFYVNLMISTLRYKRVLLKHTKKHFPILLEEKELPKFTFIVSAYNEEETITSVINNLLNVPYNNFDIIISVNGSTDSTISKLKEEYNLIALPPVIPQKIPTKKIKNYYKSKSHPKILVIEKEDKSKSDAQNAALNVCDAPFFIAIDGDTFVENEELMKTLLFFLSYPKLDAMGSVVGVANTYYIKNNILHKQFLPFRPLLALQQMDYDMSIIGSRFGYLYTGSNLIIPGAFGIFTTNNVFDVGGFSQDTLLDDVDLTLALHKRLIEKKGIDMIEASPFVASFTIAPKNIFDLFSQRERWERGTIQNFKKYKKLFFSSKYSTIGMLGLPFYAFQIIGICLLQLYVLLIFPIGVIANFYNWELVLLFIAAIFFIRAIEVLVVSYLRYISKGEITKFKEAWVLILYSAVYPIAMDVILLFSRLCGMWRFLAKNMSWKKIKREKLKEI